MRIVSWNAENLAPWLDAGAAGLPAMHARLGSPDVLCLQEVRIRPRDEAQVARMQTALPGFTCHASLNHDPHNGRFRGGRAYGSEGPGSRSTRPLAPAVTTRRYGSNLGRAFLVRLSNSRHPVRRP